MITPHFIGTELVLKWVIMKGLNPEFLGSWELPHTHV
jgi:hypothetical protein